MPSPTIRKIRAVAARASGWLFSLRHRTIHAADLFESLLQAELVEASDRQRCEGADALKQHSVSIRKSNGNLGRRPFGFCWIRKSPMRGHRLARPYRTGFARRAVADGKDEVERRCARLSELVPGLRTKPRCVIAETLQQLDRVRVHSALRLTTGTVGTEFTCPDLVQDGLGHDRARRVARAQKQDVEGIGHARSYAAQQADAV